MDEHVSRALDIHSASPLRTNTLRRRFSGYGLVPVSLTFVPVTTLTYVSDCYLPVKMDALLLVNGLKVHYNSTHVQSAGTHMPSSTWWPSASSTACRNGLMRWATSALLALRRVSLWVSWHSRYLWYRMAEGSDIAVPGGGSYCKAWKHVQHPLVEEV